MNTVLIFHDGRIEYLIETLKSFKDNIKFPSEPHKILICDTPGATESDLSQIKKKYKINQIVINEERLGIFGSVQKAWSLIPKNTEYVFHLENDFVFNEEIEIERLTKALSVNKHIFQIALLRQPWYKDEIRKGGIYKNVGGFRNANIAGLDIVLHRHFFTHNPCIYPVRFAQQIPNYNEYTYVRHLRRQDPNGFCAFLGTLTDNPKVTHIGEYKIDGSKSA